MNREIYRFRKVCYNEDVETNGVSNVDIVCDAYPIVRETLLFYVIKLSNRKEKKVRKNAHSAWGSIDKNKALKDFIRRGYKSIAISKHYIRYTELAIEKAQLLNP